MSNFFVIPWARLTGSVGAVDELAVERAKATLQSDSVRLEIAKLNMQWADAHLAEALAMPERVGPFGTPAPDGVPNLVRAQAIEDATNEIAQTTEDMAAITDQIRADQDNLAALEAGNGVPSQQAPFAPVVAPATTTYDVTTGTKIALGLGLAYLLYRLVR